MRKTMTFALAATGAALLAGAVGVSAASPGISGAKTLHLIGRQTESRFVQIGHSGGAPRLGDEFVFSETLRHRDGSRAGHDGVVCVITSTAGQGETNCNGTMQLQGGELTLGGLSSNGGDTIVGVLGGTGDYQNARGYARVHSPNNGNVSDYTIYLIP